MSELYHFGILGQRWGIRRYQNKDGSLTPAGRARLQKKYDRKMYNTESVIENSNRRAKELSNRLKEVNKNGINDEEVISRYIQLQREKKEASINGNEYEKGRLDQEEKDLYRRGSKNTEYITEDYFNAFLTGVDTHKARSILNAIKDDYISELKSDKEYEIKRAKKYMDTKKRLMDLNINDLLDKGDYKEIRRAIWYS